MTGGTPVRPRPGAIDFLDHLSSQEETRMATYSITKVQVWTGEIPDRPGGLASILEPLAAAGATLECGIARRQPDKPGTGVVYLTPIKGKKVEAAAASAGLKAAPNIATLRIEGPDEVGSGAAVMRAMQQANINVRGVSVIVFGKKAVCYMGFDSQADADNAAKILKKMATATAKKPAKRRR
jgi:hypothetical protein